MSGLLQHRRKGFRGTGAAPAAFDGFGNRSRSFDGLDDYVNLGKTTDNAIFTASAWVKFNSHNSSLGEGIFGKWQTTNDASWLIYTRPTPAGNFTFIVRNGLDNTNYICDSGIGITIGQWTHITGVADGTNLNIYVNGVSATSIAYDGTIHQNQSIDTNIGAYNNTINNQHFTDGNIADCRIYDTDLTASQVSDLYAGTNITTNLVGHWLTDADDTEDKAGSNNGTNYGSKYSYDNPSPPVEFGSASRSFDGVDDYVSIPDLTATIGTSYTVSAWANLESLTSNNGSCFFDIADSTVGSTSVMARIFYYKPSSEIQAYVRDASGTLNIVTSNWTNTGSWHHFTLKRTGSTIQLFIDGVSVGSDSTNTLGAHTSAHYTTIGNIRNALAPSGATYWMNGKIADVRIYDTDLTATEISDLYSGTDVQTNLVGHYLTDNDDVEDKAGTNDGTNFGSTYDYDAPFTEVTLPNHFWNLSDTGTYADSGKLASAGWDLNEYSSVSSSVQSIGTSTKTVLDTTSGGVLEYKNGASVDVGWDSESKEVSMACWFYCDSFSSSGNWLISWRGNNIDNKIAQLFIRNDAGLQILRGTMWDAQGDSALTPQSGTSISLNTWYHGALTWDNTTIKVYIDGELFASATNASADGFGTNTSGCEFAIAGGSWDKNGTSVQHKGYTFGAGVWDVALTENQIKALYNDGNALDYSETTWR